MKAWKEALCVLLRLWPRWLWVSGILAVAGGLAAGWLWTPLETGWHLILNAAYLLGSAGLAAWALTDAHRKFAPGGIRLIRAAQRAEFWGALAIFTAAALWAPARLVTWLPGFETLAAQAWSALVRAAAAWVLFTAGICWLLACLGVLSREQS
ncbi:MAG: hypothetical protein ACUVS7_13475 [Bryobacteraceae bacterium]